MPEGSTAIDIEISHLIPLYRSHRFYEIVVENVRAIASPFDEILICDRHGDEETCERLRNDLAGVPNLRITCRRDEAHWVANISDLIAQARGEFIRVLPHDDSTSRAGVDALLAALRRDPDASLAYGQIEAIDLLRNSLPGKDELNADEDPGATTWTLGDVLPMFWTGRFGGAFKGLIRAGLAQREGLRFRPTPTLLHSERVWLFTLGLAGPMRYVPTKVLTKRYYADSTHRQWRRTGSAIREAADLMVASVRRWVQDPVAAKYAEADLRFNAQARAAAMDAGTPPPAYAPSPSARSDELRARALHPVLSRK